MPEKDKSFKYISDIFACNVFGDAEMKKRLPADIYEALHKSADEETPLTPEAADAVASAMMEWAVEKGATHYTHWFQPLRGVTAEKHEAFIETDGRGGIIMDFSGRQLIKGEPDASSFPSGGLRATFEARGYTMWDCTSPAFIKENPSGNILCIPTAFCTYNGEALDEKTPLLRSMEALNKQMLRFVRCFGDKKARKVLPTAGAEQEYFLINADKFNKRPDLVFTGRTLLGAPPLKSQEMEGHYYGAIKENIAAYMQELDTELWKMGVSAKTRHNEAAPAQHELAPVFTTANIAADHNQIIMETMQKVAGRHGLACLLHEKPFAYINGSGKHNNWALITDTGENLLDHGRKPQENIRFLLLLCAILKAIDDHADLLRMSASTPGNDHRLGGYEAPPAIVSVYLGGELTGILDDMECGRPAGANTRRLLEPGANALNNFMSDSTDRNRTSPFAFTGNRFEFRMLPSSMSISGANTVLNTIIAQAVDGICTELENSADMDKTARELITGLYTKHKRIVFNGNGYSEEWVAEAEKRGLPNIANMVDAISVMTKEKAVALFGRFGVFTKAEIEARSEIEYEKYIEAIILEATVMLDTVRRLILPACMTYHALLCREMREVTGAGRRSVQQNFEAELFNVIDGIYGQLNKLQAEFEFVRNPDPENMSKKEHAAACRDRIFANMQELRRKTDMAEHLLPAEKWPIPTYSELLFNI